MNGFRQRLNTGDVTVNPCGKSECSSELTDLLVKLARSLTHWLHTVQLPLHNRCPQLDDTLLSETIAY